MEARKITIANTREQKKSVVMSAAATLGELKRDLDAAGINYAEMDFVEALTKTQLRGDDSVLPHDVPFNHTVTNELVFVLTVPNRKIKSGSREEVYNRINCCNDSGELKEAIKNHFNRNYTMVSTADLEDFISDWDYLRKGSSEIQEPDEDCVCLECRVKALEHKVNNIHEAIMNIVDVLDDDYLTEDIVDALTNGENKDRTVYSAGMSSEDIDELVNNID